MTKQRENFDVSDDTRPCESFRRRHRVAGDERQFPGDVRLFPVRLLCDLHLQGVLSGRQRVCQPDADDAAQVGPLLEQIDGTVASFTADGAYDQESVYDAVAQHHPDAMVIIPSRSDAVLSETAATRPTQRDGHLQCITQHGRMAWQKASGYNRRARAEAAINRYKRVIGAALRSRTDQRRATEVAIAVDVLNRMLALGRPDSIRIA